jgi:hypothetical protein
MQYLASFALMGFWSCPMQLTYGLRRGLYLAPIRGWMDAAIISALWQVFAVAAEIGILRTALDDKVRLRSLAACLFAVL